MDILIQAGKALAWYAALVLVMRLAGKRLAGQTTTIDLVVLITIGVVLQSAALAPGLWSSVTFVTVVFLRMKRTSLVLDESLLIEATRLSGQSTWSATVNLALSELVRRANARQILSLRGSGAWEGDLGDMRRDAAPT